MHARLGSLQIMQVLGGKGFMKDMELYGFRGAETCAGARRCINPRPHGLGAAHGAQTYPLPCGPTAAAWPASTRVQAQPARACEVHSILQLKTVCVSEARAD